MVLNKVLSILNSFLFMFFRLFTDKLHIICYFEINQDEMSLWACLKTRKGKFQIFFFCKLKILQQNKTKFNWSRYFEGETKNVIKSKRTGNKNTNVVGRNGVFCCTFVLRPACFYLLWTRSSAQVTLTLFRAGQMQKAKSLTVNRTKRFNLSNFMFLVSSEAEETALIFPENPQDSDWF